MKRLMIVGMLLAPGSGLAQQPGADAERATIPYVNDNFGFEVRVPADWQYERTGFFGPGGSVGVLRGGTLNSRSALQILLFRDVHTPTFQRWVEQFSDSLAAISGVQRVAVRGERHGGRPAAFIVVDSEIGLDHVRTFYYGVQFDDATVWVMSYATAELRSDEGTGGDVRRTRDVEVPAKFEKLARSLRVFYDPEFAARLEDALRRGRELLEGGRLRDKARQITPDDEARYYVIELNGEQVGYLTRRLTREEHSLDDPRFSKRGKQGLRVQERSWRFEKDLSAHFTAVDLFSSLDGQSDLYEISNARIPPPDASEQQVLISRDQCVREADVLFSSYMTNRDPLLPDPREPLRLQDTFLGLAWVRVLPALIGTTPGPLLAFTTYDVQTRTILTQSIEPLGRESEQSSLYAFRVREGFSERPSMLYVDGDGRLVRLRSGVLTIRLSDHDSIERRFGPRRDRVLPRLEQAQRSRGD